MKGNETIERPSTTSFTRRHFFALTGGAALAAMVMPNSVLADAAQVDEALRKFIGDVKPAEGAMLTLDLPPIAEYGNTVPLKFDIDSPMTVDDYVKNVHVFAEGNPNPEVASFHFTPASGKASVSTRIRLAKTQNVVSVVQMSTGKVYMAKKEDRVTIGGCGG